MESQIKNIQLRFKCDMDWDAMPDAGDARYCDKCQKKVYDLSDKTLNEFEKILAQNNNQVCGRYREEQMATVSHKQRPVLYRWASAAMVLLGVQFLSEKASAQTQPKQIVTPDKPAIKYNIGDTVEYKAKPYHLKDSPKLDSILKQMEAMGIDYSDKGISHHGANDTSKYKPQLYKVREKAVPPLYPGGDKAFDEFLAKNIKLPNDLKICLAKSNDSNSFMLFVAVEKDGTVSDVRTDLDAPNVVSKKYLDKATETELIRVIKLTVWQPAVSGGTPERFPWFFSLCFKTK